MSKEKQIDEISKLICTYPQCIHYNIIGECSNTECQTVDIAKHLYQSGYRKQKQGEWISVEDRLPDLESTRSDGYHRPRSVRVLCVCEQRSGKVFVKEGYYELVGKIACWRIPGSIDSVTHWMPLPEPPTEKEN